eukprot:XP_793570.2 PREDICTED: uncharacterized protein LOC588813 [Strongylocentrotus purpuratus]
METQTGQARMGAPGSLRTAHAINERERTSDVLTEENSNVDFSSMFLSEPVTAGLQKVGFEKPSPIQLKAIPLGRCGLDLIVQAKSGTGKTCVFSVIALEGIDLTNPSTQVLILAPTREIAVQIQDTIRAIGCEMEGLRSHVFIGGTLFGPDRQKLKKCHIAVGTPGRIKQLIEYEVLKTGTIRLFVLDEADKLLDDTFQEQVNWIYNHLSDNKQMLALSATYPEYLAKHLTKYMREPMFVRLNPKDLALRGIKQLYVELPGHSLPNKAFEIKVIKLLKILTQVSFNQCLIFSNLQTRAQNLCDILCDSGWPSECISGAQEQSQRLSAMAKLKKFQCRILISTDLTARGIDAENVNLIINLDIPTDTKTYLHRIGRAGRFGTHGAAISLASKGREMELLRNIQRQCRVTMTELPDPPPSDLLKQDHNSTGLQRVSITPHSLLPAAKMDSTRNTTTDDLENNATAKTSDDALLTSSVVNKEEDPMPKSVIANGTDEQHSLHMGINGSCHKMEDSADSLADRKTTKIVESMVNQNPIPKTRRGVHEPQKVDACIQTMQEDVVQPKAKTSQIRYVTGSGDHKDRPTLPIGFEDAPEVRKLSLPQVSHIKRGDGSRRARTWYEGKESFEKFMKGQTVETKGQGSEDDRVDKETDVIEQTVKNDKELSVEISQLEGEENDADVSSRNSHVTSSKDLNIGDDYQNKYKDEVYNGSGNADREIAQKRISGLTPIQEIERYRGLLCDTFIRNHLGRGDNSTLIKLEHHDEAITAVTEAKETESVESVTPLMDISSVVNKQVARKLGDKQDAKQTQCTSKVTKDIQESDETVKVPQVESRLHHQVSNGSPDIRSRNEPETETKPKVRNTTGGKKKGKQQRIKQHVFQMSTLGALMSPKELDVALISNPNTSSCDGDLDTNDTDREKVERFPLCNKINVTHQVHHAKNGYEESQIPESGERETLKDKQVRTSVQKSLSLENDSSVSSLDDPVWAIFKNFIPACLPSEVGRKDATLSDQSSSSLCESNTSTCSSSSSETDSGSSGTNGEEEEDGKEASESNRKNKWKGKEPARNGSGKHHMGLNQAKAKEKNLSKANSSYNEEKHYCEGQNKYPQCPDDPSWTTEQFPNQPSCNVEGWEYDGSYDYYAAAPIPGAAYHGRPYSSYSPQGYTNSYWNDYYHGYAQQPYTGYPYFSSYDPPHYS